MLINSGPFILIKLIPVSFATAFANIVLPQPGGPQRRIPYKKIILKSLKLNIPVGEHLN